MPRLLEGLMTKAGLYWDRGRTCDNAKFTIIDINNLAYQFGFNGDEGGPVVRGSWDAGARDFGNLLLPYNLWVWE